MLRLITQGNNFMTFVNVCRVYIYEPFDLNINNLFFINIQAFNNQENKFVLKHYLIKHDEARTKV